MNTSEAARSSARSRTAPSAWSGATRTTRSTTSTVTRRTTSGPTCGARTYGGTVPAVTLAVSLGDRTP